MTPAKTVTAPEVSKENIAIFNSAIGKPGAEAPAAAPSAGVANGTAAPRTGDAAVPNPTEGAPGGTGVGVEILNPNGNAVDNSSGNSTTGAAPPACSCAACRRRHRQWRTRRSRRQLRTEPSRSRQHRTAASGREAG